MAKSKTLLAIALVVLLGAVIFIKLSRESLDAIDRGTDAVACTMDAMMCPDGSYVGRVPPNCEFAACPLN